MYDIHDWKDRSFLLYRTTHRSLQQLLLSGLQCAQWRSRWQTLQLASSSVILDTVSRCSRRCTNNRQLCTRTTRLLCYSFTARVVSAKSIRAIQSWAVKSGRFRTLRNSPEIFPSNPEGSWKSICKHVGGVSGSLVTIASTYQTSAIFKTMGYSPGFLLRRNRETLASSAMRLIGHQLFSSMLVLRLHFTFSAHPLYLVIVCSNLFLRPMFFTCAASWGMQHFLLVFFFTAVNVSGVQ